ncbi:MAG TPA: serine protease, partial [Pseudonocardiaceae bacterium]|nr:serine protease [Pseudonocardiaceae bacterium]
EDEIAAGLQRTRIECEAIRSLLDRRNELRGRLDAYRAKAAGIGHSEDLELERLFGVAHELLWTAPCDLPAATRALARYQQAVSGRKHG